MSLVLAILLEWMLRSVNAGTPLTLPTSSVRWAKGLLEVVFEAIDPVTHEFSLSSTDVHRVGGPLLRPPGPGEVLPNKPHTAAYLLS